MKTITSQYNRFARIDKFFNDILNDKQHTADVHQPLWSL